MASPSSLLFEEEFQCAICLDVFNEPVSVPCGHNFCMACITKHWDINGQIECPMCKERFKGRPVLHVNSFISTMVRILQPLNRRESLSQAGDVPCDICPGAKLKALKTCLVCQTSYCETHLEPHQRVEALKRHKLIGPVENLEDRVCKKHMRPLELFCETDQMCVCQFCTESDHKIHKVVPLTLVCIKKKAELGEKKRGVQQMIEERRQKIQELKRSEEIDQKDTEGEKSISVEIFTTLMYSIEKIHTELIEEIEDEQKTIAIQTVGLIKELEQEIAELKKRSTVLEQLSHTEDYLHLLQSCSSLPTPPPTKDWTKVKVHQSLYVGTVRRAVAQLEETLSVEMKKLCDAELKQIQQYAVDVTLDPDTANPYLILSEDGKQVHHVDIIKNLPDSPKRLFSCPSVLGKQSFSSGRSYFEVQVEGKTKWDLGVARQSINRKGRITTSLSSGFWAIWLRNGNEYKALADPAVLLSLREKPQKVGVFVAYEEGLVSFYDVEARAHIYSFTGCTFTEKLYPYFCPCLNDGGKNSAPLIISPVNQTD